MRGRGARWGGAAGSLALPRQAPARPARGTLSQAHKAPTPVLDPAPKRPSLPALILIARRPEMRPAPRPWPRALVPLVLLVLSFLATATRAARPPTTAAAGVCPLPLLVLSSLSLPAHALASSSPPPSAGGISFCRCTCFGKNSTIIPLYRPAVPSNPCLSCTRQFCLDQKLAACVGAQTPDEDPDTATGEGGDVEAKCFRASSSLYSLSSSSSSSLSRTLPSLIPLPRPTHRNRARLAQVALHRRPLPRHHGDPRHRRRPQALWDRPARPLCPGRRQGRRLGASARFGLSTSKT